LLKRRSLPLLDEQKYREIFTFPVRDYYLAAGFDFKQEPYEVPANGYTVFDNLVRLRQNITDMLF
jgi:phosphoglycolate phosphatase